MPREVGDWTRDKLKILHLYLPGYLQAATAAAERVYIDAFAGPGLNFLREEGTCIDGSPLLALDARGANGTVFSRLFFIEQNDADAAELEALLKVRDPHHRAEVIVGDVNLKLPELLQQRVPRRSPTFVFLDTDGIDPRWSTLEAIAPWQIEFLINFPLGMSINRNLASDKTLAYFGTEDYKPLLALPNRERALLDFYKHRLKTLGFEHTTDDNRLIKTRDNRRLYYLVLVSKVIAAIRIMNWVLRQPDAQGQSRFPL